MTNKIPQLIDDINTSIDEICILTRQDNLQVYQIYKKIYKRIKSLDETDIPSDETFKRYKKYIKYDCQTKITIELLQLGDVIPFYNSYNMVTKELKVWIQFLQSLMDS